jgi:hypothetical protein
MATPRSSRITLEIESGADPIRGSIEHPDGTSEAFWGWLELLDELRRVAADTPERAPPGAGGRVPPGTGRRAAEGRASPMPQPGRQPPTTTTRTTKEEP